MPYFGEQKREYARKWMAARRAAWFADKKCVECGTTQELELHHIDPSTKISHCVWSWAQERREAELAKCEVRCVDHHMDRTRRQLSIPLVHGTASGYSKWCRCKPCTDAHAAERAEYRRNKKFRGVER
jgi:hypothetical protein